MQCLARHLTAAPREQQRKQIILAVLQPHRPVVKAERLQNNLRRGHHAGTEIDTIGGKFQRCAAHAVIAGDHGAVAGFSQAGDDDIGTVGEVRIILKLAERLLGVIDETVRTAIHAQAAIDAAVRTSLYGNPRLSEMDSRRAKRCAVFFEPRPQNFRLLTQV